MGTSREGYVFETGRNEVDCRDPGEKEPLMVEFFSIRMDTMSGNTFHDITGLSRKETEQLRDSLTDVLAKPDEEAAEEPE